MLEQAITAWNEIENCNLRLSTDNENKDWAEAVVEISPTPKYLTNSSNMIRENYIYDLTIGCPLISINTSHHIWKMLSDEQRKYAIMHALGHLFGLKDWESKEWIANTHSTSKSIMASAEKITEATRFSYWEYPGITSFDVEDLFKLYPIKIDDFEFTITDNSGSTVKDKLIEAQKEYFITVEPKVWKEIKNASYKIEITGSSSSNNYEISQDAYNKWKINFNTGGKYNIKVTLSASAKSVTKELDSHTEIVNVSLDKKVLPSKVELNKEFEIGWDYYNNESLSEINYSVEEKLFSGPITNDDITIIPHSKNRASVTIKNYGYYIIKMTPKNSSNSCYIHISKYNRNVSWNINDLLELNGLGNYRYPDSSTPKSAFGEIVDKPLCYKLNFNTDYLENRFYGRLLENYICNEFLTDMMTKINHWFETANETGLTVNAGPVSEIDLPTLYMYNKNNSTADGSLHVIGRAGYYVLMIPLDKIFLSNNDKLNF